MEKRTSCNADNDKVCNLSIKSETHQFPWYFINRRGISHPCRNVSILRRKKYPRPYKKQMCWTIFELSKKNSRQFFTSKPPKFQKVGQSTPNKKSYSSKTLLFEWETKISFPTTSYTIIKELLFNTYLIYNYLMFTEIFRQDEF